MVAAFVSAALLLGSAWLPLAKRSKQPGLTSVVPGASFRLHTTPLAHGGTLVGMRAAAANTLLVTAAAGGSKSSLWPSSSCR